MDLAVSGLGMVTPIGHTVESACAAHRAAIVRASVLPGSGSLSDSDVGAGLTVHALRGYADGFAQLGFWVRVGAGCLRDLTRFGSFPPTPEFWSRTWVVAAIPVLDEERFFLPTDDVDGMIREHFLVPALAELGVSVPAERMAVVEEGKCGAAWSIDLARQLLERHEAERVVILSVDTYCDPYSIAWLTERNLIKTDEQPMGLIPGEAGAAIVLERADAARSRGSAIHAIVTHAAVDNRQDYEYLQPDHIGRALAVAARTALGAGGGRFRGDLYLDLNGLEWRATVWGHAQIALQHEIDFERSRQIVPATSLGEIGCASGSIAICLAARSFARGHSSGNQVLVCSVDDFGDVAAIHMTQPSHRL